MPTWQSSPIPLHSSGRHIVLPGFLQPPHQFPFTVQCWRVFLSGIHHTSTSSASFPSLTPALWGGALMMYISPVHHEQLLIHANLALLLRRVLDIHCQIDSSQCLAQLTSGKGWKSQVCPRAIGGITTYHKMRHSLSLPTVTYICMGELPHFHHSPTTSFLHSQPIQAPPSGPGLVCAAGRMFIWDEHYSVCSTC